MEYTKLKSINQYKSKSINPAKTPETVFEMYSVPIYETGHPEYLRGDEIASSKVVVQKNDILLCKINPRINRVWVVSDESDKINIASSEWIVIRNNEYNPEFLAWYFRSRKFQKLMTSEVTGIGGSLTRAQPKRVAEYPVPILDRLKQDEIVDILNRCKFVMDSRKQELSELDTLIKARFVEMFGDPISNSKDFEVTELKDILKLKAGDFTPASDISDKKTPSNPYPCFGGNGIRGYVADYNQEGEYTLIGRQGALSGNVKFASGKFKNTEHALLVTPLIEMNSVWLNQLLVNLRLKRYQTGAAQPGLSVKNLLEIPIISVPLSLQNEFATFVQQIDKLRVVIQKSLDEAQYLFDSLMQEYFG